MQVKCFEFLTSKIKDSTWKKNHQRNSYKCWKKKHRMTDGHLKICGNPVAAAIKRFRISRSVSDQSDDGCPPRMTHHTVRYGTWGYRGESEFLAITINIAPLWCKRNKWQSKPACSSTRCLLKNIERNTNAYCERIIHSDEAKLN